MKRDNDLIRTILLTVEGHPPSNTYGTVHIEGYEQPTISYHLKLLNDAGFVEARDMNLSGEFAWKVKSLTNAGHDFLDTIRNDTVWAKTKEVLKTKGVTVTLTVLSALAQDQLMKVMGLKN